MASSKFSMALIPEIIRGRWFMANASFLIMSMAGATYIFAIYSKDIKSTLGYDQKTLNTLGFFKDFGANVGLHAGLLAEFTPPGVVISIGSIMNLFGYLMIWLAITGKSRKPHLWQMCFYIWVGANSQAFANTGALVTCVKNFPESRGVVLGLLKGFVGLSGAIFTQFYLAFYGTDSKSVVLLIAWLPAIISAVFVTTIRLIKPEHYAKELNIFYKITGVSLALAVFLLISIIFEKQVSWGRIQYGFSAAVVLVLLLAPLYFVIREEICIIKKKRQLPQIGPISPPVSDENPKVDGIIIETGPKQSHFANIFHPPKHGEDFTILQAIFSIDMILLFVATIFAIGGTLTANDNMGQIGESLGYSQKSITTFVALTSIWNYGGRIAAGFASEYLIKHYRIPRPLIFAFVILLSCVGHLTIAFGIPGCLYYASIMTGFCLGAAMPLLLSITSEVFGLKYYSTLYNICNCASPIGSYILNVRVAGKLYDDEAVRQRGADAAVIQGKELICLGVQCYKHSFLIITAASVGSALVMLMLAWRTRGFYRSDIYAKFREVSEGKQEVPKPIISPEGK